MITNLKLDTGTKLEFGVQITGADSRPEGRFIIEHKDFSIMLPCKQIGEGMEVEIPPMKHVLQAGEFPVRLEIVLDNKIFTPLSESIVFEPAIEIETKQKQVKQIKESVKIVGAVTVKSTPIINENLLRQTQAATVIANSLGYSSASDETPQQVIENALIASGPLNRDQIETLTSMLDLVSGTGLEINRDLIKEAADDDVSDDEIDSIAGEISDDDVIDDYGDEELAVIDDETGEQLEEAFTEINEVLSRQERLRARIRMARTKTKREVKARIALKKHSAGAVLQHRARRLAVKALERKLARKNLNTLSIGEKERIERIIARKSAVISRLALKMVPKVRQIEKARLAHHTFTQK